MRYLAIDHGDKRTGLAISDASETLVSPHSVIATGSEAELLRQVIAVVQQEQIQAIVVGMPYNMDGSEGPRAKKVVGLRRCCLKGLKPRFIFMTNG